MTDMLKGALDGGLRGGFERVRRGRSGVLFFRGPIIHMSSTGNAEAGFSRQPSAVRKCSLLLTQRRGRGFELCLGTFGEGVVEAVEMLSINDLD
jgi:hypothetical protein